MQHLLELPKGSFFPMFGMHHTHRKGGRNRKFWRTRSVGSFVPLPAIELDKRIENEALEKMDMVFRKLAVAAVNDELTLLISA